MTNQRRRLSIALLFLAASCTCKDCGNCCPTGKSICNVSSEVAERASLLVDGTAVQADGKVAVRAGRRYVIDFSDSGKWVTGIGTGNLFDPGPYQPEGKAGAATNAEWLAPGCVAYSLVGKIGLNGKYFCIGKKFTLDNFSGTYAKGNLFLGVNDMLGKNLDNSGAWIGKITVERQGMTCCADGFDPENIQPDPCDVPQTCRSCVDARCGWCEGAPFCIAGSLLEEPSLACGDPSTFATEASQCKPLDNGAACTAAAECASGNCIEKECRPAPVPPPVCSSEPVWGTSTGYPASGSCALNGRPCHFGPEEADGQCRCVMVDATPPSGCLGDCHAGDARICGPIVQEE